jgi:CRISPR-associated protein Cmr1
MAGIKKISATFEVVTPMFLGGADQSASRIREASIKGALAFWWRALTYSRYVQRNNGDLNKALADMLADEQILFGSTKGQGAFLLKVSPGSIGSNSILKKGATLKDKQGKIVEAGARYLGYGLMGAFGPAMGQLTRDCLLPGLSFTVDFIVRRLPEDHPDPEKRAEWLRRKKRFDDELLADLVPAIELFGLLGGLGSRSRRGWGSVALTNLKMIGHAESSFVSKSCEAYQSDIKSILDLYPNSKNVTGRKFQLTSFSKETEIHLGGKPSPSGTAALHAVGDAMQLYRSWGDSRNGSPVVNGRPSEMNFKDDHDWSKGKGPTDFEVPLRIAFGLPQNYKDNDGVTGRQNRENKDLSINRRAGPLLIHVHKTGDGNFFPVISLFPNLFLPADDRGLVEVCSNRKNVSYDFSKDGARVLEHFLSQSAPAPNSPKPFSNGPYLKLDKVDWIATT